MPTPIASTSAGLAVLTALLSGLAATPAAAQAPAAGADKGHECLIEPNQRIEIRSPATALIERVLVDRGAQVRAGDVLVVLDGSVDQAELKVAEAELALAVDNRKLAGHEAQRLEAVVRQRQLRAPFAGVVTDRLQQPGELAFTGEGARPILKLAQTHPLRVEVVLPVALIGSIKPGRSADIVPEAPLKGSWRATVKVVDRVVDSASGSFGVRLELANPNGEIPAGVKCRVRFL